MLGLTRPCGESIMTLDLASALNDLRTKKPLVHHITNSVTINDCANITLCIGGAPVMAEAPEEVVEMVAMAGALVLNIGTLSRDQISTMLIAGREANVLGIPVVLDPVGAGATRLRTESAHRLLSELQIAVVKGNAGEIGVLAGAAGRVRGVDSAGLDGDPVAICKTLANAYSCTVAMSGATDIVTDGNQVVLVDNGSSQMGVVSGTGCMASSLAGAFSAGSPDFVHSTVAALAAFGLAGERAARHASGPSSFKMALFDEVAALTPSVLSAGAKIQIL
jgi:hydroxyethylthiazole kinase